MIPKSIRWRLSLSYMGIALLVALAIGVVLLTTLRGYYRARESDYLTNNARALALSMTTLIGGDMPSEALESQLRSLAFIVQARVRILGPTGEEIADSGDVNEILDSATYSYAVVPGEVPVTSTPADHITGEGYLPIISLGPLVSDPRRVPGVDNKYLVSGDVHKVPDVPLRTAGEPGAASIGGPYTIDGGPNVTAGLYHEISLGPARSD